jgi:hypothetical protein
MSKETQEYVARFAGNSIRYLPALAHSLGSVNAAIMLSQLLYWQGLGHRHDGYFFKTADEMFYETGLSEDKQIAARRLLLRHGIIYTKRAGVPAKTHYYVDTKMIVDLLTSWRKSAPLQLKKSLYQIPENQRTITETTHHTTQIPP